MSSSYALLDNAKRAFSYEQYNDTSAYLNNLELDLENKREEKATFSTLKRGTQAFFVKYWQMVLIVLAILGFVGYKGYKTWKKKDLQDTINKFKAEKEAVYQLIKKAQEERFKKAEISGLVYNVRMQKYNERLNKIDEELPVLEESLRNYK